MARYFSVEEAAKILGTTDRTIRRMLNEERLAGSQHQDKGKLIWRVHATKEILQKLEEAASTDPITADKDVRSPEGLQETEIESSFMDQDDDSSAADTIEEVPVTAISDEVPETRAWVVDNKENSAKAAEDFWKELETKYLAKLLNQEKQIGSLEQEIRQRDDQIKQLTTSIEREKDEAEEIKLLTYKTDEQLRLDNLQIERDLLEQRHREAEERASEAEKAAKAERERLEFIKTAEIEIVKRLAAEAELKRKMAADEIHHSDLAKLQEEINKLKTPFWKKWFSGA
jgi:excisionase family DNA binding protein